MIAGTAAGALVAASGHAAPAGAPPGAGDARPAALARGTLPDRPGAASAGKWLTALNLGRNLRGSVFKGCTMLYNKFVKTS